MKTMRAADKAKGGFYWNLKTWEVTLVRRNGDTLPGAADERYVRIPTAALVIVGPMMGFLFVVFLPFIGFALTFRELYRKAAGWLKRPAAARREAKNHAR